MSMAGIQTPRSTRSGLSAPEKRLTIADVTGRGSGLPNRYVLHGVEKWGKSSTAAHAPKPVFIQSRGETGLDPLIDAGLIPDTPHFPECQTWMEALSTIDALMDQEHGFKTAVFDTINGLERLCHEYVCIRDFGGDWGERGFASYGKGAEVAAAEWRLFLSKLDMLRAKRRMTVFMLCHTRVNTFKNPLGNDYDRYQPDLHKTTWSLTSKWADVIIFANFETSVALSPKDSGKVDRKGKGVGGQQRIMYTERTAAYDAGNRIGLPEEIEMGNSPKEGWDAFMAAIKGARAKAEAPIQPTTTEATN